MKLTFFSDALFTMRSEGGSFVCSESVSLYEFFSYYDQRCLALYLREATMLRDSMIQNPLPHSLIYSAHYCLFYTFIPLAWCEKAL